MLTLTMNSGIVSITQTIIKHSIPQFRMMQYRVPPLYTLKELQALLPPMAHIVRLTAHEPIVTHEDVIRMNQKIFSYETLAAWQRVKDPDGSFFIDDFGFHVYTRDFLDLRGRLSDVDTRYKNLDNPSDYDLCNRTGPDFRPLPDEYHRQFHSVAESKKPVPVRYREHSM